MKGKLILIKGEMAMKRIITTVLIILCLFLTACNAASIGIIGGADEPTSIYLTEKSDDTRQTYDVKKYFKENYIDESKLPVLDVNVENTFVSDDRTLTLEDSIEKSLELMVYEYYRKLMSGSYQEVKDIIVDGSLLAATEAHENNFKNGIYYSQIIIEEIDLVDREALDEITESNKQNMIKILNDLKMTEFAIVEVEKVIKHNEKSLSSVPQVGDGEVERYYLLGKKDNEYKIVEVYWEGFLNN